MLSVCERVSEREVGFFSVYMHVHACLCVGGVCFMLAFSPSGTFCTSCMPVTHFCWDE